MSVVKIKTFYESLLQKTCGDSCFHSQPSLNKYSDKLEYYIHLKKEIHD